MLGGLPASEECQDISVTQFQRSSPNWSQHREEKYAYRVQTAGWNRTEQVLTT